VLAIINSVTGLGLAVNISTLGDIPNEGQSPWGSHCGRSHPVSLQITSDVFIWSHPVALTLWGFLAVTGDEKRVHHYVCSNSEVLAGRAIMHHASRFGGGEGSTPLYC
jgi:hypothetical protein